MMRIIKVLTAALLIVSVSFTANAMADKKYYTIHEIQEQAGEMLNAAGLTGTIEVETTKGKFNVSIEIPEVDRVPIVQTTFPSSDQVPPVPENGTVTEHTVEYYSASYLTGWVVDVNRDELYGEYVKNTHRIGQYGMDAYADGSPLTMEESIAFAEQILHPYKELCGWEFSLQRAYANSRRYKATAGRNGFIANIDQPVDDTGYYTMEFKQTFYGIPYDGYLRFTYPSKNDREAPLSAGDLHFDLFSPDCYSYVMNPSAEQAVLAEDVPLCSLETCIKAFKDSGRYSGQAPTKLRFVYAALNDPNDRNGDHLVLVPVWMLESDKGPEWALGGVGFVNAQTGEWINTEQKDKNEGRRSDAVWFGW